jgi:hypothetical protein
LVASVAVAAAPASFQVMLSPTSKPIEFSYSNRYVVWHDVICDEIKALRSNQTWSLVPFHPLMNVVGSQ